MSDLDFELDIDTRVAGAADTVTELDAIEKRFKASKSDLDALEKSFADTDKSLEKLASQLADTRIEMQRAMQAGDNKKFWKLAQTTDDLTKKEEALRKKSGELKTAITAQQKATQGAADKVGAATAAEKKHELAGEANDKRTAAASALLDRYGGKLGSVAKSTKSAVDQVGDLTAGLDASELAAVGAVGALALVAVAVVAVGIAFVAAAASVYKYAVEQANAKRNTEQTLRALTQNNEAAKAASASFESIGHDTGASNDQLLQYSRGLTEARRQMGLAQASTKDYQTVLRAAATASQAMSDDSAGQAIIDQFNAGLMSADKLADRVDKKYGDVVKQKMLGLDQQTATLSRNLSGLTEHFDVKPVLEGLSRMVDLTDKNTASGKFLQDIFDTVFGKTASSLVEKFFVAFEREILKTEVVIADSEIYFYKFKNAVERATDIDLGPFGNLHDRINDIADVSGKAASKAVDLTNGVTAIGHGLDDIAFAAKTADKAIDDMKNGIDPTKWMNPYAGFEKLAGDLTDGFIAGLDKGIARVKEKVKGLGGEAIKAMKSVLDSHSPSRVFADIGLSIPEGLEQGVDLGAPSVAQSIDALVEPPQLPQAAGGGATGAGAGRPPMIFNIEINGVKGAEDAIEQIKDAITEFFEHGAMQLGTDGETT